MTAAAGPGASTLVDRHAPAPPAATEPTAELAASLGFRDPAAALAQLAAIRADLTAAGLFDGAPPGDDDAARRAATTGTPTAPAALVSYLISTAGRASEPDRALGDIATLVRHQALHAARPNRHGGSSPGASNISSRALDAELPGLTAVKRAAAIVAASPPLTNRLVEQPALLSQLEVRSLPPLDEAARTMLRESLGRSEDDTLRALRDFKHGRLLGILALDLEGALSLDEVSHALSDLADLLLSTVLARASAHLGLGTRSPIGIVCYGKLGSREMSYASDTDIVFVYDRSDGDYDQELVRMARLANHWITTPTREGVLYATDFRLRPYGDSGLVVSSLSAFRDYQFNAAWTWEHQALTRARWLACSPGLSRSLDDVKAAVLTRPRPAAQLRADVLDMRARIAAAQRIPAGLFDVKHSRGGIVDLEFIVQHMILRHAAQHPILAQAADNAEALAHGADLHLVPAELAQAATAAFRQYRHWMHRARLSGTERVLVAPEPADAHRQAVTALWQLVFAPG